MAVVRGKVDYKRIPWNSFETWGMRRPTKKEAAIINRAYSNGEVVIGRGVGLIALDILLMLYGIIYGVLTFRISQGALILWCAPAFSYGLTDILINRVRIGRYNGLIKKRRYMCQAYEMYRIKDIKYNSAFKSWVCTLKLRYFDQTTGSDYQIIMPKAFARNKAEFDEKIRTAKFLVVYIAKNQYYRVIPVFNEELKVIDELD